MVSAAAMRSVSGPLLLPSMTHASRATSSATCAAHSSSAGSRHLAR